MVLLTCGRREAIHRLLYIAMSGRTKMPAWTAFMHQCIAYTFGWTKSIRSCMTYKSAWNSSKLRGQATLWVPRIPVWTAIMHQRTECMPDWIKYVKSCKVYKPEWNSRKRRELLSLDQGSANPCTCNSTVIPQWILRPPNRGMFRPVSLHQP